MTPRTTRVCVILAAALLLPAAGQAQGYRLRLDAGVQSVRFRGYQLDSVAISDVDTLPDGSLESSDGFAVDCGSAAAFCSFFRPGAEQSSTPLVATADLTLWGLGIRGLSVRLNGRYGTDLSDDAEWPGTEPGLQLLEGFVEYAAAPTWGVRAGRQVQTGRLGYYGYDGGRVVVRAPSTGLEATGYLGLGLARGALVPITSAAANPLGEYRPAESQLVAGATASWITPVVELNGEYQREVDRTSDYFTSERIALSGTLRPAARVSLVGGSEYDIAQGFFGTTDVSVRYTTQPWGAVAGWRRYRPHFDLWTIWGAFSPVPYNAGYASAFVNPIRGLQLRLRGERYQFDDAEAESPLVTIESEGWRASGGASYRLTPAWLMDLGYHKQFGPGAASEGWDGAVTFTPTARVTLTAHGNSLDRPLEYRYDESRLVTLGLEGELAASDNLRIALTATRHDEDRERPDAASFEWDQLRLGARVVLLFSSGADRAALPPARVRRPAGR
jgi:hypothetical protein